MKKILIGLFVFTTLSSFAADKYNCQVSGKFTNSDNNTAKVDVDNLIVEVDASSATLFGRAQNPQHDWDTRPEVMPWSISLSKKQDGRESPLVLSLKAPNQNGSVGTAYAAKGSKYIGFVIGSHLEALCIKL